ncbi:Sjogren's syndrome/scleroderma autoantigen 1 family protein [Halorientalis pallida]|uniref:Sjogren's syndrome/scleroderma autoantigen 1 family protein n=1 Tax=Halorientalis pallida TaxID=2479928 RepID=UPI003C6EF358
MSDFDKEAEREKLREKYGDDEDDREATERMSDLLLKGATMTNAHCGTCGDPIFRYEGQEFCSTCQEVVSEADDGQGDADQAADDQPAETDQPTDTQSADGATAGTTGDQPSAPEEAATASDAQPSQPSGNGRADAGTSATPDLAGHTETTDASNQPADWTSSMDPSVADAVETEGQSESAAQATAPNPAPAGGDGSSALAGARESLEGTIVSLTRQAAASDDLERTRAYLAAVEEAADALAAVKRADR